MQTIRIIFQSLIFPLFLLLILTSIDREAITGHWHIGHLDASIAKILNIMLFATLALLTIRIIDIIYWKKAFRRHKGLEVPKLTQDLISALIWLFFLILYVLVYSDKPETYTGVFATSSVLIAIIGFAMRDLVADFFSGIALGFDNHINIGDWIDVGDGTIGKVIQINWRMMRIVTRDNLLISIPNSHLSSNILQNYNRPDPLFRETINIVLPHELTEKEASRLLLSAALQNHRIRSAARQPDVKIDELTERGTKWMLRFWLDDYDKRESIRHDIMTHVQKNLQISNIPIPPNLHHITMQRTKSAQNDFSIRGTLNNIDLFQSLSQTHLSKIADEARELHFEEGEIICNEGETTDSLYIVGDGILEVRKYIDGEQTHLATLSVGDFFGEFSLLTAEPRSATIMSLGHTRVFEITKSSIEPILCENPELVRKVSTSLAERKMRNSQLYHTLEEEKREQRKEKFISTYIDKMISNFSL